MHGRWNILKALNILMQLLVPEPTICRQQSQHSNKLRIAEYMHRQGIN